jgi:hypothetical protein
VEPREYEDDDRVKFRLSRIYEREYLHILLNLSPRFRGVHTFHLN